MHTISQMESRENFAHVRELFREYLQWAGERLTDEFGISFYDVRTKVEHDMAELEMFEPPDGRLLLAVDEDEVAGLACLRKIGDDIGEIKRMYVRPAHRGRGIGRALLETLIDEARGMGLPRIRLDSVRFMTEAHSLYRSAGFHETEPYPESEIPEQYWSHWVFMEVELHGQC